MFDDAVSRSHFLFCPRAQLDLISSCKPLNWERLRNRRHDTHERALQFAEQFPRIREAGRETAPSDSRKKSLYVCGLDAARSGRHWILTQEQNQLRMIKDVRVAGDAGVRQREQEVYD